MTTMEPAMIRPEAMRPKMYAVLGILVVAAHTWAQPALQVVYVASFRKGSTRIAEQTLVANLNSENPVYRASIKDSRGRDRYQLFLEPQRVQEGDASILSWRVLLVDPQRRYLGNLLVATRPPTPLSDRPEDRAWWLDPNPYAVVPVRAKRIFKVEDFYCVIQVKDYRLPVPERLLLASMQVEMQFTETEPQHN
jgi:hypothetical protein